MLAPEPNNTATTTNVPTKDSATRTLSSSRIHPSSITFRKSDLKHKDDLNEKSPQLPLTKPCHYGIYTSCSVLLLIVFCIVVKGLLSTNHNSLIYVGGYQNSLKHGTGQMIWPDGAKYAGNWKFDQRDGRGRMQWPDGAEYIGQWKQGRRNGKGTFTTPKGDRYIGDYVNGVGEGHGTYTFPNGNQYIGNWKGGKMNGQGTYLEADGTKYHGKWVNGNLKGIEPDGSDTAQSDAIIEEKSNLEQQVPLPNSAPTSSIEVHTKDDKHELPSVNNNNNIQKEETHVEAETIVAFKSGVVKNGKGSYVWPDGTKYIGDWKNNKRHGKGQIVFSDGKSYVGDYADGQMDGKGTYIWPDGKRYEGMWKNNNKHGSGQLFDAKGNVLLIGSWQHDVFIQ